MKRDAREERLMRVKQAIDDEEVAMLSDPDQRYAAALLTVVGMLLSPDATTSDIVNMLKREHGYSQRNAYLCLSDAKLAFGDVFRSDRAVERQLAINRAEKLFRMAMQDGDVENALKANKQIIELRGLDQDDTKTVDPTLLEPSVYKLSMPREVNRTVRALLSTGRVDLADLLNNVQEAQVVPDLPDAPEQEEDLQP